MNPTPTISEAARRLADRIDQEHAGYRLRGEQPPDTYGLVLAAMSAPDSAHPAPKEGETPEMRQTISEFETALRGGQITSVCLPRPTVHYALKQLQSISSFELRLSEAKREMERLRCLYENGLLASSGLSDTDQELNNPLIINIRSLRSHLKTANELLGAFLRAHDSGTAGEYREVTDAVRTHLNQQSK